MQVLSGSHVPRFVAAGDLENIPYLVMEYVPGQTLDHWLELQERPDAATLAQLGEATALAVHSLHQKNTVHLDLKPANVIIRSDGSAVLLDFGLSCNAMYPDLLAEQLRKAVGSPAWIAPEQVVGVRGDPRSDIFAVGVMLYELATGELPFGSPKTTEGMRQRLWMDPPPPRKLKPELPEWLQEVDTALSRTRSCQSLSVCGTPGVRSAPPRTGRGDRAVAATPRAPALATRRKCWLKAAGMHYQPSPLPTRQIEEVPIVMVAVPHNDVSDATLYSLRQAVARSLGTRRGARLACVTVISPGQTSSSHDANSETSVQRKHIAQLRQWAQPLDLPGQQTSYHVLESSDVAQALVKYAIGNEVSVIVMGAATHGLKTQRFVATVPIKVAMRAPCTVILVKQALPFSLLVEQAQSHGPSQDDEPDPPF